jgi:hypothetical protein
MARIVQWSSSVQPDRGPAMPQDHRRLPRPIRTCVALLLLGACAGEGGTPDADPSAPARSPSGVDATVRDAPNGAVRVAPPIGTTLPPGDVPRSRAYTLVLDRHYAANPPRAGECDRATHARWWTYGPDGKVYPTWHPPTDPVSGCTFGHEHGRDPRGSVWKDIPLPFGYASEALAMVDPANPRDEDHVGHKVEWENALATGTPGNPPNTRCDVLTKLHQGTHSHDALANNTHELFYHVRCANGMELHWQALSRLGVPAEVEGFCAGAGTRVYRGGTPTPLNSQAGIGKRLLPDAEGCVTPRVVGEGQHWAIGELWIAGFGLEASLSGVTAADRASELRLGGAVYMAVRDPARFIDVARPDRIARMVEVCAAPRMRDTPPCAGLAGATVPWDDVRSPFKGASRQTNLVDSYRQRNTTGATRFYTDPLGARFSRDSFPGGVLVQWIGPTNGLMAEYYSGSIARNYASVALGGVGVRAPN